MDITIDGKRILTEEDLNLSGLVPKTTTVNGKALSGNITLSANDVGAATTAQGAKADSALQNPAAFDAAGVAAAGDTAHLAAFAHGNIAHANRAALDQVSGTNTGDQNLSGLAPISHVGATGGAHGEATALVAGFMSTSDKAKLDNMTNVTSTTDIKKSFLL